MGKKYRMVHGMNECIGDFVCVTADSKHWKENAEELKVDLVDSKKNEQGEYETVIDEADLKMALEAAKICPVNCIHIFDLETGEKLV